MPCVSPDGKPTSTGLAILKSIKERAATPEEISNVTGKPLFRVRSGLRELMKAGFLKSSEDKYVLTEDGKNVI